MEFGSALVKMQDGRKVTREGWNGPGMWVTLSPGASALSSERIWSVPIREYADQHGGTAAFRPYLMMKTAQGDFVPWAASQSDLLATDWVLVD